MNIYMRYAQACAIAASLIAGVLGRRRRRRRFDQDSGTDRQRARHSRQRRHAAHHRQTRARRPARAGLDARQRPPVPDGRDPPPRQRHVVGAAGAGPALQRRRAADHRSRSCGAALPGRIATGSGRGGAGLCGRRQRVDRHPSAARRVCRARAHRHSRVDAGRLLRDRQGDRLRPVLRSRRHRSQHRARHLSGGRRRAPASTARPCISTTCSARSPSIPRRPSPTRAARACRASQRTMLRRWKKHARVPAAALGATARVSRADRAGPVLARAQRAPITTPAATSGLSADA